MSEWQTMDTAPRRDRYDPIWVYVPRHAEEPTLPEGTAILKAYAANGVWCSLNSEWALVHQHAPTHWADGPKPHEPPPLSDAFILANTFRAEEFLRWTRDSQHTYPSNATFDKWEAAKLVELNATQDGYVLTAHGKRVSELSDALGSFTVMVRSCYYSAATPIIRSGRVSGSSRSGGEG